MRIASNLHELLRINDFEDISPNKHYISLWLYPQVLRAPSKIQHCGVDPTVTLLWRPENCIGLD